MPVHVANLHVQNADLGMHSADVHGADVHVHGADVREYIIIIIPSFFFHGRLQWRSKSSGGVGAPVVLTLTLASLEVN